MIEKFVEIYMENKESLMEMVLKRRRYDCYRDIVNDLVRLIMDETSQEYEGEVITEMKENGGDYSGNNYYFFQHMTFDIYAIHVSYGSCSGCDALERINSEGCCDSVTNNEEQAKDILALMLHIVQSIKKIY